MARTDNDTWDLATSVGATATMVAAARAIATKAENPLIDDRFADPLVRGDLTNCRLIRDFSPIRPRVRAKALPVSLAQHRFRLPRSVPPSCSRRRRTAS